MILKIMLEGWHVGTGALRDCCQNISLPVDLYSSARDGFTTVYAQGTEEAQRKHRKLRKKVCGYWQKEAKCFFLFPVNL